MSARVSKQRKQSLRLLLLDIGNTHTHLGLSDGGRVLTQVNIPTASWFDEAAAASVRAFIGSTQMNGACLCSVVPKATARVQRFLKSTFDFTAVALTPATVRGIGIDYPRPETIGPDRLANAVAVRAKFGAPSLVVDFGTAVTFDVVDGKGNYIGGIIAPGLAAMTDYLHEKTALLPKITIREVKQIVGKNTEQAMLIGAVHGYRGLVRELIGELKRELNAPRLPVVATGGYAKLMATKLPEITAVEPTLTLEGLRLVWMQGRASVS